MGWIREVWRKVVALNQLACEKVQR